MAPVRRAELFVRLRTLEQSALLAASNPELAAAILADCDSATLSGSLSQMDFLALQPALKLIPPEDLADILLHLTTEKAAELEKHLDPDARTEVRGLMQFDPETAGGLMTPRCMSVPGAVTVARALELLRATRADAASYVYVVDPGGRLVGTLALRKLLLEDPRTSIDAVAAKAVVSLKASAPRWEIVKLFSEHHYVSLPVVDDKERLIGIVTYEAGMEAMRASEGAVVKGLTGADPGEALRETLSATRSRIPWVTVTVLGGLACALIGGLFHRTLAEIVVLGIFVPIVLALGESIGAQTVSVVLSTLTSGRVTRAELATFLAKEVMIGLLVGLYAGLIVAGSSMLWHGQVKLGAVIGGAVVIAVTWAAFLGVVIPSVMHRLRVNVAIASGPLVLALVDVSTLLVYFGSAAALL